MRSSRFAADARGATRRLLIAWKISVCCLSAMCDNLRRRLEVFVGYGGAYALVYNVSEEAAVVLCVRRIHHRCTVNVVRCARLNKQLHCWQQFHKPLSPG